MTLALHESGPRSADAVVFLHGVGNNGTMWRAAMGGLPEYHCLAPDLPGHGASRSVGWRSRQDTAARIANLIEERTIGRAHVVGLSLGASVVLELLATRAELLDHVIVDGCSALGSPLIWPMKIGVTAISPLLRFNPVARVIGRAFGVAPGRGLDAFVAQITAVDPRSFHRAFTDANAVRITPPLLAAPRRTLFVAGERELGYLRASNRILAERMPDAEARMVPGVGHGWGASTRPELHLAMIRAWLRDAPLPRDLMPDTTAGTATSTGAEADRDDVTDRDAAGAGGTAAT